MQTNIHCLNRVGTLLLSLFVLNLMAYPGLAQQSKPLPKYFAQKVQMRTGNQPMLAILDALTQETHVNILVDDEPLRQNADLIFNGTLREALDRVGNAFDYTWTVSKGGVVLMSKTFKNYDERPQVNLPEMLQMTRDILNALNLVQYDKDETHWPLILKQVAQSFTPEQAKVLNDGKKLRGSDLFPEQQQALQQAILSNTFLRPLHLWEELLPNLESMPGSRMQARKHDAVKSDRNTPLFDYLYVFRGKDGRLHVFELPHLIYQNGNHQEATP